MNKRTKYDIGLGVVENVESDNTTHTYSLAPWNKKVEEAYQCLMRGDILPEPFLPVNMWNEWLWGYNPTEACSIECLLNRSHLLGLLLARYRAVYQEMYRSSENTLSDILGPGVDKRLCLIDTEIRSYTLRHLRDTVQNIQLNWVQCDCVNIPTMPEAVNALLHRFGTLASRAGNTQEMNDQGSIEDTDKGLLAMNRICIRRFVCTFMIMYRHLHFNKHAEPVPRALDASYDCCIRNHHLTASTDDFSAIAMHWDIMISAKLNYIHDFPGMFNCVSQVAYFHNQSYQIATQERSNTAAVTRGMISAIHVLPPLMQLYPDIEVVYEEAHIDLLQPSPGFSFIIMGQKIYLLTPTKQIYYHPNVTILVELYLSIK
jgi:hypothetical protein